MALSIDECEAMNTAARKSNVKLLCAHTYSFGEGQEIVSRALLEPSRRVDVPTSLVPDYVLPQPGVKYDIDQYSEEWQRKVAPKLEERLQKALGK